MKLWLLVSNLSVCDMETLPQIRIISGTSFLQRNTWRAANFQPLKIVHCEPSINASFGNMPETGRLSLTSPDRTGWPKNEMEHLVSKLVERDSTPEGPWSWLCAGVRRDAMPDVFAGELDSPARPLALVKTNAATSKKMTKTRNINPLYQFVSFVSIVMSFTCAITTCWQSAY